MARGNRDNHPPAPPGLPILCLDFDGVIHDYRHGWKGGEIYGDVTPGFFAWLSVAKEYFRIVIYSSRTALPSGVEQMKVWLASQNGGIVPPELEFAAKKPPAFLTIDDRCVTFRGSWQDMDPRYLRQFVPWMLRKEDDDATGQREATPGDAGGREWPLDAGDTEERRPGILKG